MGRRDRAVWQMRAWGNLLASAASYPVRKPHERRLLVESHLEAMKRAMLPTSPLDALVSVLPDDVHIRLEAVQSRPHNCSTVELLVLAGLSRILQPQRVFEIGTYDGRSALAMAINTAGEVYTLNLPPDYLERHGPTENVDIVLSASVESGARFRDHPERERIHQLLGDSKNFDFAPYRPSQLIFIDGAHDTDTVRRDSANMLDIVDRGDGAIVWHDATSYGVRPVVRSLARDGLPLRLIQGTDIAVLRFKDGEAVGF